MISIQELVGKEYIAKFKVNHPQTLFEPVWENLRLKRCPLCSNKIHIPYKGKIALCNSKKHGRPFIILKEKLYTVGS